MAQLELHVAGGLDEFEKLRQPWNRILERVRGPSVFSTWEWAFTWWQHFGAGDSLHILVVHDGSEIVALAPLFRMRVGTRVLGFETLMGIGQEHADYGGFLWDPREPRAGELIGDCLARLASAPSTVVNLTRFMHDDPALLALRDGVEDEPGRLSVTARVVGECPYIDLTSLPDPQHHISRLKKRRSVDRLLRRLRERHEVEFRYHMGGSMQQALGQLVVMHERRFRDKGIPMKGLFAGERNRSFARDVVDALDAAGYARMSLLNADGAPIAACLGFELGGRYHYHKPAFEPSFAAYKPGHLLVGLLLDEAVARGLQEFNFGRGDAGYKERWTDASRSLVSLWLESGRTLGRLQRSLAYRAQGRRYRPKKTEIRVP